MYPIKTAKITMEIVIKTAAVTPPTTPLLSVQVQLLSVDAKKSVNVKEYILSESFDATFIILTV